MRLRYSRRAARNRDKIAEYLVPLNPQAAANMLRRIEATLQLILEYPLVGREVEGNRRRIIVRHTPYVIFYSVHEQAGVIDILTIRYAAKRPEAQV